LYTALTVGEYATNPSVYGPIGPIILEKDEIVEVVINNRNKNLHPFHLHGHQFQLLDRPDPKYGTFNGTFRPGYPHPSPAIRDTIMLQPKSWAVIRFKADNPGVWPLHCHVELHVNSGFTATFVSAVDELQGMGIVVPEDHLEACRAFPMNYEGNAAGNMVDPLDLTGAVTEVPDTDYGSMYPHGTPPTS
jgi:iron transport multicopper oxidase